MRIVLDTNVVVSGLLWDGPPRRLLRAEDIQLCTSVPMLLELSDVLSRPKFRARIAASLFSVEDLVVRYGGLATVVRPEAVPRVAPDPDDDIVIATAIAADADFLVTGDADLLRVKSSFAGSIVSVADAINLLPS